MRCRVWINVASAVRVVVRALPGAVGDAAQAVRDAGGRVVSVLSGIDQVVATVPAVNKKSLPEIAERRSALIAKAREGKVVPEPCSLTVSNLGMHGVRDFAAIINPPEIAILAVGAITPVVQMDDAGGDFRVAKMMSLTLSSDHRALSGVQAARFLNSIRSHLEQPETWISVVKV